MSETVSLQQVQEALQTIIRLENCWITPEDLRHNHHRPIGGISASPNPDRLPFGLDLIISTPTRTRTREGAEDVLYTTRIRLANLLNLTEEQPREKDYLRDANWLLARLAQSEELPEVNRNANWLNLVKLAKDALIQTAHGSERSIYVCPDCGEGVLERPYSAEGIMDIYLCDKCGKPWSLEECLQIAKLIAKYGDKEGIFVTQSQAADILDIPLKTIYARVKRGGIKPVKGSGRSALYDLRMLKKD